MPAIVSTPEQFYALSDEEQERLMSYQIIRQAEEMELVSLTAMSSLSKGV